MFAYYHILIKHHKLHVHMHAYHANRSTWEKSNRKYTSMYMHAHINKIQACTKKETCCEYMAAFVFKKKA
jgi:hypothetical protein